MRNLSKNKFLLCFRPVVDIDAMLESKVSPHRSASCRFPCIPISEKHETMKNSEKKTVFSHQGSTKFSRSWIMQHPPKRTFSGVIQALVFKTILNRRTRHKNCYVHDSFGSKHSCSTCKETKAPQWCLSNSSSHGSDTSSSISHVSQSQNLSKEKHKEGSQRSPLEKQKKFESYGIYLILISLAFTVLCGKLFGIILTSIWLSTFSLFWTQTFTTRRSCQLFKERDKFYAAKIRVIMEGVLQGNYHNGALNFLRENPLFRAWCFFILWCYVLPETKHKGQ